MGDAGTTIPEKYSLICATFWLMNTKLQNVLLFLYFVMSFFNILAHFCVQKMLDRICVPEKPNIFRNSDIGLIVNWLLMVFRHGICKKLIMLHKINNNQNKP